MVYARAQEGLLNPAIFAHYAECYKYNLFKSETIFFFTLALNHFLNETIVAVNCSSRVTPCDCPSVPMLNRATLKVIKYMYIFNLKKKKMASSKQANERTEKSSL